MLEEVISEPSGIEGMVDFFRKPSTISGWIACSGGDARRVRIAVFLDQTLIGEAHPDCDREDIVKARGVDARQAAGFTVKCTQQISEADLLGDSLSFVAYDGVGDGHAIGLYEKVRLEALLRTLTSFSNIEPGKALIILDWLGGQAALPSHAVENIREAASVIAAAATKPIDALKPSKAAANRDGSADFWVRFQSLGHDCTVGEIQRHFGAEPLGLFRFSGIRAECVIEAIETDFAGIGSAEFTSLIPNHEGEYFSYDSRYHMASHTFIFENEQHYNRIYPQQCRKIEYLARLLREDIEDGEKIFVVHNLPEQLDLLRVNHLHNALKSRGAPYLLYVCEEVTGHPAGTLTTEDSGLFIGYVSNNKQITKDQYYENWRQVCQAVLEAIDKQKT